MITKLIVGGFKSIRERTEIPIAPLTLLFGPNSAGKSAVLGALDALSNKLTEKPEDEYFLNRAIRKFANDGQPNSHQHPLEQDQGEPTFEAMTLGLEICSFSTDEKDYDGNLDDARRIGLDLFHALDGSALQLEFFEKSARVISTVSVDGQTLIEFVDRDIYLAAYASNAPVAKAEAVSESVGDRLIDNDHWDALILHTDHPLWASSGLVAKFAELTELTKQGLHPFTQQPIEVRGDRVVIRTVCHLFHAQGWGDQRLFQRSACDPASSRRFLDYESQRSLNDLAMHGAAGESDEATLERWTLRQVMNVVDLICASVSFLVFQMRFIAHNELEFARVVGDRKVLTHADLTTEFDLPQSGDLRGPQLQNYAAWLGVLRAGDNIASTEVMDAVRERDDFINDTLRHNFFPARGYQVKPEVLHITTAVLLDRIGYRLEDAVERLKVRLFLEDANGRTLDFTEVGSGVSYVLPVLISLWGADRSWIEQPELHLHPTAQCELGDVVIRAFNRGRFSITETHSEHLLLRVLRRIRQTSNGTANDAELKCHPEAVSILYFEPLPDGSTKIRPIRVSRSGDFMDRWPHGFFSERDRELLDE